MSGLYLVADDLTGALDSAACFCGRFGPIPVFLGRPHAMATAHAAIDLATRDASAEFAVQAATAAAPRLSAADIAFKKIDSLLRGHWAAELHALLRSGAFRTCVFAPAFPSQGRTMAGGRQVVRADDGSATTVAVDPAEHLRRLGLRVAVRPAPAVAGAAGSTGDEADVVIFDAASDDDLLAIVRWGKHRSGPVLWCGSAGLAQALAQRQPPRVATVKRPVLAIVGTDHAVTRAQTAFAVARDPARQVVVGDAVETAVLAISRALAQAQGCVMTFELAQGIAMHDAAAQIGQRLGVVLPRLARPSTLVVAGGETLLSVCRALGATHLEVDAEMSPGVPHSRLCGGPWNGLEVVSKSGAFGAPTWLDDLLTHSTSASMQGSGTA